MRQVRCEKCGMINEVDDITISFECKMCENRVNVSKCEEVKSFDDLYDTSRYHLDSDDHRQEHVYENDRFVDRVEEEKILNVRKKEESETETQANDKLKKYAIRFLFLVFVVISFFLYLSFWK